MVDGDPCPRQWLRDKQYVIGIQYIVTIIITLGTILFIIIMYLNFTWLKIY